MEPYYEHILSALWGMSEVRYHSKPIYHLNRREKEVIYLLITVLKHGDPEKFSYSALRFVLRAPPNPYALNRIPYLNK